MKKLILMLVLPCLLAASDKSKEPSLKETVVANANEVIDTVSFGVTAGATIKCVLVGGAALYSGNLSLAGEEALEAVGTISKCALHKSAWKWAINPAPPTPEKAALDKAYEDSAKRAAINEEMAGARFRRCLSENAHCTDLNGRGIPRRCNSPARDYAMINDAETDRVIANFLKFSQQNRKGSV